MNMTKEKRETKWTLVMSEEVKQKAIKYCEENGILFKEYAEKRLDPECPQKQMILELAIAQKDDLLEKNINELFEILIEKKIKGKIIEEIRKL